MVGGKYFVGVNFGAMDKYREPLTAEQWKHCVASLKVRQGNPLRKNVSHKELLLIELPCCAAATGQSLMGHWG